MLRFYGIDLDDLWSGRRSPRTVANAAAHLPRGGAVGEWVGGPMAVTAEVESTWEVSYVLAQANSKKNVKPREFPKGVREVERTRRERSQRARDRAKIMADMRAKLKAKPGNA